MVRIVIEEDVQKVNIWCKNGLNEIIRIIMYASFYGLVILTGLIFGGLLVVGGIWLLYDELFLFVKLIIGIPMIGFGLFLLAGVVLTLPEIVNYESYNLPHHIIIDKEFNTLQYNNTLVNLAEFTIIQEYMTSTLSFRKIIIKLRNKSVINIIEYKGLSYKWSVDLINLIAKFTELEPKIRIKKIYKGNSKRNFFFGLNHQSGRLDRHLQWNEAIAVRFLENDNILVRWFTFASILASILFVLSMILLMYYSIISVIFLL